MNQPILLLYADNALTTPVSADILRCEGFPWLEAKPAASFVDAPPDVELIVVAGSGVSRETAERLGGCSSCRHVPHRPCARSRFAWRLWSHGE